VKTKEDDQAVLDTLLGWAMQPDNSVLEAKAKELVDQLFADPSLTFQVAGQATLRERMKGLTGLFKYQQQIEAELFSEKRLKEASTGELSHLWKTVGEAIAVDIELAKEGQRMDRPRFDKPRPVNRRTTLQLLAKPEGEHHNGNG
jgi:hypothetical protein